MDLKEFIKDTVSQMAQAISELNADENLDIVVNPQTSSENDMVVRGGCSYKQTSIHFNIALTISDEGNTGGKIGVLGGFFAGGVSTNSKNQSQALTSLDFRLDVLLPQG